MTLFENVIDKLSLTIESKSGVKIDKRIVVNSFLFVLSSAIGKYRLKIDNRYINFFGMTFAHQGDGKDLSLSICEEIFSIALDRHVEEATINYEHLHKHLPEENDVSIIPEQYKSPIRGSMEGIMRKANFYNEVDVHSLNVIATEFGHEVDRNILSVLITLWQSAKADGMSTVNQKYPPVFDVPTNILLFGSPEPFLRNKKKHDELVEMLLSGLGRRSLFVFKGLDNVEITDGENHKSWLIDYVESLSSTIKIIINEKNGVIFFTDKALEERNKYKELVVDRYNKTKMQIDKAVSNSMDMIDRIAALIAISNMNTSIEIEDIRLAQQLANESYKALKKIIEPQQKYKTMFNIMKNHMDDYFYSISFEEYGVIFNNSQEKDYHLDMLEEIAYYNGYELQKDGKRMKLSLPKETSLSKMILSVSADLASSPEKETKYINLKIPFFGEDRSVEKAVTSDRFKSFILCHLKSTASSGEYGHRAKKNAIKGQNMIAFDIDEEMSIEEAKEIFKEYTYIIYTTRNHQKEKNGLITDRFRIIIPTKHIFKVDEEEHRLLIENIADFFNLPIYDEKTKDITRLWFTNTEAEVFVNRGDLLNVHPLLPDTKTVEAIKNTYLDGDIGVNIDKRIEGMFKWTVLNGTPGNRNNALSRLAMYLVDIGYDNIEELVFKANAMFSEPLSDKELHKIIRSKT